MISVEEALAAVLERARPLPPQRVPLPEALGCTLAEDVAADLDSPPFDKSLVDGYAVRAEDLAGTDHPPLRLVEEITAGRTPTRPVGRGETSAIMTGAPMPDGADAVVMVERSRREGDGVVFDGAPVKAGQNRLTRGREMRAGDLVARQGERLNPARLGLLASVGRAEVRVVPRPKLAVISTGDELVEPGRPVGPGQIRNSNATLLSALASDADARVVRTETVGDTLGPLRETLSRGLNSADVVLVTGGVSAGTLDLVPGALASLGVTQIFHKIRLKPGKPLWFGTQGSTLVFGLPGNPVSGLVGFLLFVRPALARLAGADWADPSWELPLATPFTHGGDRPTYHPARVVVDHGRNRRIEPLAWAGSADLRAVASADGFAVFPAGDWSYAAGEIVRYLPLG